MLLVWEMGIEFASDDARKVYFRIFIYGSNKYICFKLAEIKPHEHRAFPDEKKVFLSYLTKFLKY